jgi:C-terminal processing protease CtpA/Prc
MLADKPFKKSRQRTLDYRPTFRAWGELPGWFSFDPQSIPPDTQHLLTNPVIVLTSARTFSAAETFVVAFDAMHRGKLVGQPTGGSTGQPLLLKLPGGGSARICTKDDSYPDGKVFEGKGIVPQIAVEPSVEDIRQGRDPVVEAALKALINNQAR